MVDDEKNSDLIKTGDYIIIQRQEYAKLHKFGSKTSCASLGRETIELANIENCKYFTTFKMIPQGKGKNRSCSLEPTEITKSQKLKDNLVITESGTDNRNITDDGSSQKLSKEEISALRDEHLSSKDIVGTLINNSNTFSSKTEYSQEKYLKKKDVKYHEYVQIRKPSLRAICEIMYRQDPGKINGIRIDTLSQIISYSNVNAFGNHLIYDSGSNGLLSAALLNAIGSETEGNLIHMHPGNTAQKQALLAMNFKGEQLNRCTSVNLYSVLRHYYQNDPTAPELPIDENEEDNKIKLKQILSSKEEPTDPELPIDENEDISKRKRMLSENGNGELCKKIKLEENTTNDGTIVNSGEPRIPKWQIENEKACVLLRKKVDSLIIACKEHPFNVFKFLMTFVSFGRPFVIYHAHQEPLQNSYISMRKLPNVVGLKLTHNWMRGYQVLPDRTHPEVTMPGNSGYLLSGWIVDSRGS